MTTASAERSDLSPDGEEGRVGPFVRSRLFAHLFAQGMELVETTAGYLDDEGRKAARDLSREAALAYAGTSMRLTTRLMQIASWLLVLRAVREGEMAAHEAGEEKYRIGEPERAPRAEPDPVLAELPETLRSLIEQTDTLHARIVRLDADLFAEPEPEPLREDAAGRLRALRDAFGE